jgi:formylglycine-generating enzyme required for sulfatase activity
MTNKKTPSTLGLALPLCVLAVTILGGLAPETRDTIQWIAARFENTADSYQTYLRHWPAGSHAPTVRGYFDERVWSDASHANTVVAFTRYLAASPQGQHVAEAQAALAAAKTKENAAKAAPVIARLETAVARRDKFGAEDVLAELEALIPSDSRMTALRDKVAALPGPKKNVTVDLGGGVSMTFVLIRPGTFQMGDQQSVHKVTITKPFYMGKYEVTQEQWERVMGSNPSTFKGAKNPVEQVSWDDCQNFVAKLKEKVPGQSFRLPTEAEWEYACRAGSTGDYCYGEGDGSLGEYAWYSSNDGQKTHPVGEKKPSVWGLYDMHGNVWEWCADWYGGYDSGVVTDPVGPSTGSGRVLRGGSWLGSATGCRSALRYGLPPSGRRDRIGFRVVLLAR